jgi:hypothetical protein
MSTLHVQKVGSKAAKVATLGGELGTWGVYDGDTLLATARIRVKKIDIEADGRRLTAHLHGLFKTIDAWDGYEVVDDATGETVLSGRRTKGQRQEQEWDVRLRSGTTITWLYRMSEKRLGYFDADGTPIMQLGHDPSFDTKAGGGTLRVLLRFWGAALASTDRFLVTVEDGAVGRVVAPEALPILALMSMWLAKSAEASTTTSGGAWGS